MSLTAQQAIDKLSEVTTKGNKRGQARIKSDLKS